MIYTETKALKVASKKGFKVLIDGEKLMLRAQTKKLLFMDRNKSLRINGDLQPLLGFIFLPKIGAKANFWWLFVK